MIARFTGKNGYVAMNMRLDTRVQEDSIHLPRVIIQFSIIFSPLSSFPISKAQLMNTDETKKNNNEKFLSSCTLHCKINPNLLAKIGNTTLQKCSNYSIICRLLINSKRLLDRREKEGGIARNSLDGWQFISLKPEAAAGSARLNARPDAFYMANSIAIDQIVAASEESREATTIDRYPTRYRDRSDY